jgi:anti-sigma factor RsiW
MTMSGGEHDVLRVNLGVLALGKLDGRERRVVLEHADECPECRAELDDFLSIAELLRHVPEPVCEPEPMV